MAGPPGAAPGLASEPAPGAGAVTNSTTTAQGGAGAAGESPAWLQQRPGGRSLLGVERRRSSVVQVTTGRPRAPRGVCEGLVLQARHLAVALLLALLVAPVALCYEPLVRLVSRALPNVRPTAPCRGLLMDDGGVYYIVTAALGTLTLVCGTAALVVETAPRVPRVIPHVLVGVLGCVLLCAGYASSATGSVGGLELFLWGPPIVTVAFFTPCFSFAVWNIAAQGRDGTERAPASSYAIASLALVAMCAVCGVFTAFACIYVVLSDRLSNYSTAGLLINGMSCVRTRAPHLAQISHTDLPVPRPPCGCWCGLALSIACLIVCLAALSGFVYPVGVAATRHSVLRLMMHVYAGVGGDSLDFAGVVVLILEIFSSTPQFYVLAVYVVGCPTRFHLSGRPVCLAWWTAARTTF
jgi:hypothetical protein